MNSLSLFSFRKAIVALSLLTFFCTIFGPRNSVAQPDAPAGFTRNGSDLCPENSQGRVAGKNLAGYDENNPKTITRDQDTIGDCKEFAASTFLCASLKSKNLFDSNASNSKISVRDRQAFKDHGCSALDLMVRMFNKQKLAGNPNCQTMRDFNRDSSQKNPNETDQQRKQREAMDCFAGDIGDVLAEAQSEGMCPESYFPSEFTKRQAGESSSLADEETHRELLQVLERLERKQSNEASVGLVGICPDCSAEALIGGDPTKISDVKKITDTYLKNNNLNDFEILLKINKLSCPDSTKKAVADELRKMKFSSVGAASGDKLQTNEIFKNNKPVILNVRSSILRPDEPVPERDALDHYVVGYSAAPIEQQDVNISSPNVGTLVKKCSIAINSSWGNACSEIQKRTFDIVVPSLNPGGPQIPAKYRLFDSNGTLSMTCDQNTGSFLLSQEIVSSTGTVIWYEDSTKE